MIPLYCGFDKREAVGFHAFVASVMACTKEQVAFIPTNGWSDGTNAFTRARFHIPLYQSGFAIFADACDMVCRGDIKELWEMRDPKKAVQVVKHDYNTRHKRKYVGTSMEADNSNYPRKNWASLMIVNCDHPGWQKMHNRTTLELLQFRFLEDGEIGALPPEWNHLVDEYGYCGGARLLHWTAGIPAWKCYHEAEMAEEWFKAHRLATHADPSR